MAPHELQNKNIAELRGIKFCQRVRKVSSEIRKAPILDLGPIQREAAIAVLALAYQSLKETHRDSICFRLPLILHCSSSRLSANRKGSSSFLTAHASGSLVKGQYSPSSSFSFGLPAMRQIVGASWMKTSISPLRRAAMPSSIVG
jgi:hypothetical protein